MEKIVKVLDHGYVALVEVWGGDERVVEAARMSTDKGFLGWGPAYLYECSRPRCGYSLTTEGQLLNNALPVNDGNELICPSCRNRSLTLRNVHHGDEKLLRYLRANHHDSPFEFAGMVVEVQAPIFVFREWHRHRTQSYNEMSARYTPLPDVNYVPTEERLLATSGTNKQAQSTGQQLTAEHAMMFQGSLITAYEHAEELYQGALRDGVPKELARLVIPVGRYSRMRASANLRNWLHFLTLRMDEHAQWEIRQYADVVGGLIAEHFPRTWALFAEARQK